MIELTTNRDSGVFSELKSWMPRLYRRPDAKVRLYCFHYAGGGASSFYSWSNLFPETIEVCPVQLPGREERLDESCLEDFQTLMDVLVPLIAQSIDRPYAIYGHSMGANIGYEVAKVLSEKYNLSPLYFFSGAYRSPCVPYYYPSVKGRSDQELIEMLDRFNGTPTLLMENPELMDLFLPIFRSDFLLAESYRYSGNTKLPCPIVIFNGRFDKNVSPEKVSNWIEHSVGPVEIKTIDGDHFFLKTHGNIVASEMKKKIQEAAVF